MYLERTGYSSCLHTASRSIGDVYLKKCRDLDIEPNHRALPSKDDSTAKAQATANGSLDGFVGRTTQWTREGLIDHICECMATADMVCLHLISFLSSYTDYHV